MAQFQNMIITRAGLDMIAQSQAGGTLIFTKGKLGDGQIGDQSIPDLTDLINAKMSVELSSVTAKTEGHVEVRFIVDNTDLDVGFFVREVGIFAKVNEEGEEKLYGYANAGNYTNYLADKTVPIDSIITKIDLAVGNASNIAFTTDKSVVYVTLEDLEEAINAHNIDEDAHEAAFNKHNADPNAHADFIGATSSAAGKRGMVPAPAAGNNNRYLKSDGTWGEIDTMQGATSGAAGKSGLVPVPTAGANNRYLSADGTWKTISGMKGATSSAAGAAGLVPAPAAGENDEFLRGDGTWQPINTMKGASASAAGAAGLVPAPAKGDHGKALLGDGTWELLIKAIAEASGTITVTKSDGSTATVKQILKAIQDGNGNNIVNTYATKTELSAKAPLASPTFTGTPKSTTPASSDNSTRIATTAFVKARVGAANNGGIVSANLAQNGYVKFANGFILQWGLAGQTDEIVTFPVAFASAVFTVVKSLKDVTYSSTFSPMYISNTNYTLTGFTQNRANTVIGGSRPWVAFGK